MLCDAKADVNVQDLVGRTPAWVAVTQDGRKAHLERLLKESCDINIPDKRDKRIALQVGCTIILHSVTIGLF